MCIQRHLVVVEVSLLAGGQGVRTTGEEKSPQLLVGNWWYEQRFAKFVTTEHHEEEMKDLLELQQKHEATNNASPSIKLQIPYSQVQPVNQLHSENRVVVLDLVRKWGLKYDGGKDPSGFIERAEELSDMYNVDLYHLPRVMPEFFKDKALIWFRNNNKHWEKWSMFKKDFYALFLPTRYFEKLENEIRKRTQCSRETFKEHVLPLQDLMRHSNLAEDEKNERILRNAHPDYQWYIQRKDFSTLNELIHLADDLESIPTHSQHWRGENLRMVTTKMDHVVRQLNQGCHGNKHIENQTRLIWEEEKLVAYILIERATRSFITPTQVRSLSEKPIYVPVDIDVLLAHETPRVISRAARFKVTLGNITSKCEFLHSAPETFQRALDQVIGPEMEPHAFAYLDDIIVIRTTFQEHIENLKKVFERLRAANLKINPEKCEFFKTQTKYLGHVVTKDGIKTDPGKIAAIKELPPPNHFLLSAICAGFCNNFKTTHPTPKEGPQSYPDLTSLNRSDYGPDAVLTQTLNDTEKKKNYSATEKECLAIAWGVRKMKPYLEGYELARWAVELQQYKFDIQYRRGKQNVVADAFSRQHVQRCFVFMDERETGGSTKAHRKLYKHFSRDINDDDNTPWKLCVAAPLRKRVMQENHDNAAGGHLGIRKTINKVASRYYWPKMSRDICRYVRRSASRRDAHFSKWCKLIPLRKATAESLEKAFRERILARYVVPKRQFTAPYTPQENPTERKFIWISSGNKKKKMNDDQQKFEDTRQKFHQNMEKERAKIRKTIFLEDDNLPSTSKGVCSQQKRKNFSRSPKRPLKPKRTAFFYRMTTQKSNDPEDSQPPPPPPLADFSLTPDNICEEKNASNPTSSPSEIGIGLGDVEYILNECDLPTLEEIFRRFFGENDQSVDIRPGTPPSPLPPRSPSSLDWENENYRPPTPPRRRGIGSWELKESQYRHLGYQCSEKTFTNELPKTPNRDWFIPLSPSQYPGASSQYLMIPKTPGRDWFIPLPPTPIHPSSCASAKTPPIVHLSPKLSVASSVKSYSSPKNKSASSTASPDLIFIVSSPSSATMSPSAWSTSSKQQDNMAQPLNPRGRKGGNVTTKVRTLVFAVASSVKSYSSPKNKSASSTASPDLIVIVSSPSSATLTHQQLRIMKIIENQRYRIMDNMAHPLNPRGRKGEVSLLSGDQAVRTTGEEIKSPQLFKLFLAIIRETNLYHMPSSPITLEHHRAKGNYISTRYTFLPLPQQPAENRVVTDDTSFLSKNSRSFFPKIVHISFKAYESTHVAKEYSSLSFEDEPCRCPRDGAVAAQSRVPTTFYPSSQRKTVSLQMTHPFYVGETIAKNSRSFFPKIVHISFKAYESTHVAKEYSSLSFEDEPRRCPRDGAVAAQKVSLQSGDQAVRTTGEEIKSPQLFKLFLAILRETNLYHMPSSPITLEVRLRFYPSSQRKTVSLQMTHPFYVGETIAKNSRSFFPKIVHISFKAYESTHVAKQYSSPRDGAVAAQSRVPTTYLDEIDEILKKHAWTYYLSLIISEL
ncbi:Retrovirus-related Pol polyprotein from transposon 17.6 [Lucilia cuprina]|nr:Retrovirus-related Pol polyprotein from transposon 17.6 [Lucilia cuprina]